MAKYSKAAQEKIGDVMHEFNTGELETSAGEKVKSRKQAIAIGISEAKQEGLKAPDKKTGTKTTTKKAAPAKAATKKSASKKSTATNTTKKAATKKATVTKAATKKAAPEKKAAK